MIKHIFRRIFPKAIDNQFRGPKVALYIFYFITAVTLWRSFHHFIAPDGGAQTIATIPLDIYSGAASATIIGVFALWGLSQSIVAIIYLLSCIRYRALIPLLYLLLIFEYGGRVVIRWFKPIATIETPPGALISIPMIVVSLILLGLCLLPSKNDTQK